jgi:hypothetical protein
MGPCKMAFRHHHPLCTSDILFSLSFFHCVVSAFVVDLISAQINPQDDFDGYMQQRQQQEAEETAYRARLAAHEVSEERVYFSGTKICPFFTAN